MKNDGARDKSRANHFFFSFEDRAGNFLPCARRGRLSGEKLVFTVWPPQCKATNRLLQFMPIIDFGFALFGTA